MPTHQPRGERTAVEAVQRLRLEAATGGVIRAFESAGVQSILLKGASLARWLYEDGAPRAYTDCDLLVRPADWKTAEGALAELGFQPSIDEAAMPSWWVEHAVPWWRHDDGTTIDLHRTLPGVGADPERVWATLAANVEPMVVGRMSADALNIPGRAFHLALHAAQHAGEWGVKLEELQRALSLTGESSWRAAAEIAAQLEGTPLFAAGLRLVPEGRALADHLDLPAAAPVEVALLSRGAPPEALGFEQLARAGTLRRRLSIVHHKLVPPATFMRHWSPLARRGRRGLMLAYLWRPLWLLGKAPSGFLAWWTARRSSAARPAGVSAEEVVPAGLTASQHARRLSERSRSNPG
jgi:hypothetical protein